MALLQNGFAKSGVTGFYDYPLDQSARISKADSASIKMPYTSKGTATNLLKFTFSGWVKRCAVDDSTFHPIISAGTTATNDTIVFANTDKIQYVLRTGGSIRSSVQTDSVFRDPSAWYHVVVAYDAANAKSANRCNIYVNGVQQEVTVSDSIETTRETRFTNNASTDDVWMGYGFRAGTAYYSDMYRADFHMIDGQTLDPRYFAEEKFGVWVPKEYTGTYGNNGFHIDFSDVTSSAGSVSSVNDSGPNGLDFDTVSSVTDSDIVADSPTNNHCTWNPLDIGVERDTIGPMSFSDGNLRVTTTEGVDGARGTIWVPTNSTKKYYFEIDLTSAVGKSGGISSAVDTRDNGPTGHTAEGGAGKTPTISFSDGALLYNNTDTSGFSPSFANGDILGVAINCEDSEVYFSKNGSWIDGSGSTTTFASAANAASSGLEDFVTPFVSLGDNRNAVLRVLEDHWDYTAPAGYVPINAANLPDPVFDPAQESYAGNYFDVYTYPGNGNTQLIGDVVREIPDTYPISQSLRFDHGGNTYLTFDPSSDGDKTEWTFSTWFKRAGADARMIFGQGTNGSNNRDIIYHEANGELTVASYGGSYVFHFVTEQKFNDSATWYHLVVAYDSSQATDTDRVKIWVNGLRIVDFSTNTKPNLNDPCVHFNSGSPQYIGKYIDQGTYWNGYQAETHWIDGTAYANTDFGAFDGNGIWYPITPSVTYGTNGWHIDYSSASYTSGTPDTFADQANSNDFSAYGFDSAQDIVPDTPTNQFPVLDSNRKPAHLTLTEGNLVAAVSTAGWEAMKSAIGFETGKWYWEIKVADDGRQMVGVMQESSDAVDIPDVYIRAGLWNIYYTGDLYADGAGAVNLGFTFGGDDVLSIAFDADTGKFWMRKNGGAWFNSGDPANGTNELFKVPTAERIFPSSSINFTASRSRWNFGADATFAGDDTGSLGPYSDGNSVGEFYYQPPTGFLAICENNLSKDTTNVESPDFVWIKGRSVSGENHVLIDSARGVTKSLYSSYTTVSEETNEHRIRSLNKNGFVIGSQGDINTYGRNYVAWVWKAGGTGVANTLGDINSTVSVNTDAGFSITLYTGDGTIGTRTVGHGLSQSPEFVIVRNRDEAQDWMVWTPDLATNNNLRLNSAAAADSPTNRINSASSTTVELSADGGTKVNSTGDNFVMYCFHSVDGFSKVGYYTGDAASDDNSNFVFLGFRPAFVMIKADAAGSPWLMFDSKRKTYNVIGDEALAANSSEIEGLTSWNPNTSNSVIDFLSNGFKIRTQNTTGINTAVNHYYLAFAEMPLKYSLAR